MIRVISSVGNPTDVNTITMVTRPAWGIPAAPMLAAVAVMLFGGRRSRNNQSGVAAFLKTTTCKCPKNVSGFREIGD